MPNPPDTSDTDGRFVPVEAMPPQPGVRAGHVPIHTGGEMDSITRVTQALAGKLDLDEVLGVVVSVIGDVLDAEGASILLVNPETRAMSFHVAAGPAAAAARHVPLPPGAGLCGHVARTGEAVLVNDAQHDQRLYRRVDQTTGMTTRNLMAVPLSTPRRLWGVLEVINKLGGADFEPRDLALLRAVGGPVALALENAHLHRQVVQSQRMAAVGQTVSGLAHCIKNILNGIRSGSTVVDRHLAAGDYDGLDEPWQVVRQNNEMLQTLVLDMLSLAKEARFHAFPTDINDLAEQICRLQADRAAERGIEVTCEPQAGLEDVLTDPTQLYRCLLNLVSNAVEACGEGGHVCVRVHRGAAKDRVTIAVRDNGPGITPANRAKLFTEFFTTKGSRGTGLGLPVTRKLLRAMGGEIAFHTAVGRGTTFLIVLPITPTIGPARETSP